MATQVHQIKNQVLNFPTTAERELELKIDRYMELKALQNEFNRLQKELKEIFENTSYIEIGKYTVSGSMVKREGYIVPAFEYWNMKISAK